MMNKLIILFLFFCSYGKYYGQKMDNKKLLNVLHEVADTVKGQEGSWQIKYFQNELYIITDENHNRIRIITPIIYVNELDSTYYIKALEANFHSALDVRYAIADNIMWSVFIHPLKELSANQVKDAISQVYNGAVNFGRSYSSTDLIFPGK